MVSYTGSWKQVVPGRVRDKPRDLGQDLQGIRTSIEQRTGEELEPWGKLGRLLSPGMEFSTLDSDEQLPVKA